MSEVKTNKISSLASNNDITLDPDGTGDVIVASGNVGIGTATPAQLLEISGTAPIIRLTDTGASNNHSEINADYTSGSLQISADTANASSNSRIIFAVDNTERMRIASSGNVGIGTDSPALNVEIVATAAGSVNDSLQIRNNATSSGTGSRIRFINSTDSTSDANGASISSVRNGDDNDLVFETENTTRMTIDASGNTTLKCAAGDSNQALQAWHPTSTSSRTIARFQSNVGGTQTTHAIIKCNGDTGLGTTTTSFRLNVVSGRSDYVASFDRNVDIDGNFRNHIKFSRGGTAVGEILTSQSATQYGTSSDHRLKENVEDMTEAIARVKQLSPKRFSWIVDELDSPNFDGFLAHEAQTVVPQAVSGTHNAVDDDGKAVMQGSDHSHLVPVLTAALKEAVAKIETLETEMTALKARVTALENA